MFKKSLMMGVVLCAINGVVQAQMAPPATPPDERYKADILVVVAHPDDETEITGYLARAIYEQHKRVAVIFGTRGNGGGDAEGMAQADALSAEREIEARKALAYFGVMNVWFLDGPDTPGQDVLRSLETWNHGAALWKAVRIMRLTRPQVVMTWMPEYVAGENHGDHQAAGVIATEAFDLAGNATFFPEQLAAPRDRFNIGNLTEGLLPWQPQKLYFFSDATNQDFMKGKGPEYSTLGKSPQGMPYYELDAHEMEFHLTQGDTGQMARRSLKDGDYTYFKQPVRMILGKTLVGGSITGDPFEGTVQELTYVASPGYVVPKDQAGIELGGPFSFYQAFWQAHQLSVLEGLLPVQIETSTSTILHIPVILRSAKAQTISLNISAPKGWSQSFHSWDHYTEFPVSAGGTYPVYVNVLVPENATKEFGKVTITASDAKGAVIGRVSVDVRLNKDSGLPQ